MEGRPGFPFTLKTDQMESNSISLKDLNNMLKWSLDQKIADAIEKIDLFYNRMEGKTYIGYSGGKDSTVLRHLVDSYCKAFGHPDPPLVFNNTTNEFKEMIAFVKAQGDRVIWLKPKMTFAQSLIKNGYPVVSKEQAQYIREAKSTKSKKLLYLRMNGRGGDKGSQGMISKKWQFLVNADVKVTEKCCKILKKDPAKAFEKETGLSGFLGTTTEEGTLRKQSALKFGCNIYSDTRSLSRPMLIWTEKDVWAYIKRYDLPYCSIYDDQVIDGVIIPGEERTGCAYCGFGQHLEQKRTGMNKFQRLSYREPNRYKSFMDKLGYRSILRMVGIQLADEDGMQGRLF